MNFQSNSNSDKLKLPPISAMDDFLPTRTWAPQLDEWKSPPYKDRNELSRDSSYYRYSDTSPIPMQQTSPQKQIEAPESPQQGSSCFQYTSNINNAPSPSSLNTSLYTPSRVDNDIEEVVRQCNTLCDNMVNRKSQFINSSTSSLDSSRPWLDDMIGRANEVLNALLRLRKHQMASEQLLNAPSQQNAYATNDQSNPHTWRIGSSSPSNATHTSRQRKRGKRPAFQGRCHSCNISETPEWRRGPDGARTLCNACGLHYAKLARKQQEGRGMSTTQLNKLTPPLSNATLPTG